jgi:hypothetical protein
MPAALVLLSRRLNPHWRQHALSRYDKTRFRTPARGRAMNFFSRFGYLVAVFFVVGIFIADGVGAVFQQSSETAGVLTMLFWGLPCVICGRILDHPGKRSNFFGLRLDYWGYGLIAIGLLDAYLNWGKIARDWIATV